MTLLCWLIGHKFERFIVEEYETPIRKLGYIDESPFCLRCGRLHE